MSDLNRTVTKPGPHLLDEFPPHTHAAWKEAAKALLKGAPFEKRLRTPTWEGFALEPIYGAAEVEGLPHLRQAVPGMGNGVRGNSLDGYRTTAWAISQELIAGTPKAFNAIAKEAISCGQTELNICFDTATRAGRNSTDRSATDVGVHGVAVNSVSDVGELLHELPLETIAIYLRVGAHPLPMASMLFAAAEERGVVPSELRGCVESDPLGYLASEGWLPQGWAAACDEMAALTRFALKHARQLETVAVQGHPYHDGGASSAEELGAVLATGVEYLRALSARGLSPSVVAPHIRLSVSIGSQSFIEIAKLRALRLLWSRVLEAFGVSEEGRSVHVHARTGLWNKTRLDPYVNMLRTATEAFSAVVGGVDSLHIGPFDEVIAESDAFSRRIARNTHHILAEECDLTKVVDPAGGSWAVERLTHEIAEQGWKQFQRIETLGGMRSALEAGAVQKQVAETLVERRQAIAQRREIIVGTNNYPAPLESNLLARPIDAGRRREDRLLSVEAQRAARPDTLVASMLEAFRGVPRDCAERVRLAVEAASAGATLAELAESVPPTDSPLKITAIPVSRASAEYENLVEKVRSLGAKSRIRQVNLGPSRRYRLRADWTSAFFRVGGFDVLSDDDYPTIDDAVRALENDPVPVAIITADDDTYAAKASDLAKALKSVRPDLRLYLAGLPSEREDEWRAAGIEDFVHIRVNNLNFNTTLAESLAKS